MHVNNVKTPIPSYAVDSVSEPYSISQMHFCNKQQSRRPGELQSSKKKKENQNKNKAITKEKRGR